MSSQYTDVVFTNRQPDQPTAMKLNKLKNDLSAAIASVSGGGGGGTAPVMIFGEIPGGAINGVNKVFTSANAFRANSLGVFLNGLRQVRGGDYTETGASSFSFVNAPLAGDSISIDYVEP